MKYFLHTIHCGLFETNVSAHLGWHHIFSQEHIIRLNVVGICIDFAIGLVHNLHDGCLGIDLFGSV